MVANQGKITTLNDGISGTTGLTDGTDKMHSGILKALFAIGSGSRVIECGAFTEDTTGSFTTYTLAADIIYTSLGVENIIRTDQTITMTAANSANTRHDLIYIDTDNTMKVKAGNDSATSIVPELDTGEVPVALIEVVGGSANDASHKVQLYLTEIGFNDSNLIRVKAASGASISKGQALYISGTHNANVAEVNLARADSSSTMPCIGIAFNDMASTEEGFAVVLGKANGVAANFTAGDTLYVSPTTAGALTDTKPTSASHLIQNVGILFSAHDSNASVKVTGVGRTNDIPNTFSLDTTTVASDDKVVILDTNESDKLKTVTVQSISDLTDLSTLIAHTDIPDSDTGFVKRTGTETYDIDTNTYITASDPTLDSVTSNGNTTSNNVTVGDLNAGTTVVGGLTANDTTISNSLTMSKIGTLDTDATVIVNVVDASQNPTPDQITLPPAVTHDGKILYIKNMNTTNTLNIITADVFENNYTSLDPRYISPTNLALKPLESVLIQAYTDSLVIPIVPPSSVADGWLILDTYKNTTGISSVIEDTAPQLGGDLDVNGNKITSASSGDVEIEPNGTGGIILDGDVTVDTGHTFSSTRLPTVSVSASTTLTEATHAGRYLICAGDVTLPSTSDAGEHYTILNTTGGDITVGNNSNDINGSASSITVGTYNAVTCIAIGSNNWIALGV